MSGQRILPLTIVAVLEPFAVLFTRPRAGHMRKGAGDRRPARARAAHGTLCAARDGALERGPRGASSATIRCSTARASQECAQRRSSADPAGTVTGLALAQPADRDGDRRDPKAAVRAAHPGQWGVS